MKRRDAIDALEISAEAKRCLRNIKREVEGAYRDRLRLLESVAKAARRDIAAAKRIHGSDWPLICRVVPTMAELERALNRLRPSRGSRGPGRERS